MSLLEEVKLNLYKLMMLVYMSNLTILVLVFLNLPPINPCQVAQAAMPMMLMALDHR